MNVVFPKGRYGLSEKSTDFIVPEAMFLPDLRKLIPMFTGESMLGEGTERGLELHLRLKDNCSVIKAEIFSTLKAIEAMAGGFTSDSKS